MEWRQLVIGVLCILLLPGVFAASVTDAQLTYNGIVVETLGETPLAGVHFSFTVSGEDLAGCDTGNCIVRVDLSAFANYQEQFPLRECQNANNEFNCTVSGLTVTYPGRDLPYAINIFNPNLVVGQEGTIPIEYDTTTPTVIELTTDFCDETTCYVGAVGKTRVYATMQDSPSAFRYRQVVLAANDKWGFATNCERRGSDQHRCIATIETVGCAHNQPVQLRVAEFNQGEGTPSREDALNPIGNQDIFSTLATCDAQAPTLEDFNAWSSGSVRVLYETAGSIVFSGIIIDEPGRSARVKVSSPTLLDETIMFDCSEQEAGSYHCEDEITNLQKGTHDVTFTFEDAVGNYVERTEEIRVFESTESPDIDFLRTEVLAVTPNPMNRVALDLAMQNGVNYPLLIDYVITAPSGVSIVGQSLDRLECEWSGAPITEDSNLSYELFSRERSLILNPLADVGEENRLVLNFRTDAGEMPSQLYATCSYDIFVTQGDTLFTTPEREEFSFSMSFANAVLGSPGEAFAREIRSGEEDIEGGFGEALLKLQEFGELADTVCGGYYTLTAVDAAGTAIGQLSPPFDALGDAIKFVPNKILMFLSDGYSKDKLAQVNMYQSEQLPPDPEVSKAMMEGLAPTSFTLGGICSWWTCADAARADGFLGGTGLSCGEINDWLNREPEPEGNTVGGAISLPQANLVGNAGETSGTARPSGPAPSSVMNLLFSMGSPAYVSTPKVIDRNKVTVNDLPSIEEVIEATKKSIDEAEQLHERIRRLAEKNAGVDADLQELDAEAAALQEEIGSFDERVAEGMLASAEVEVIETFEVDPEGVEIADPEVTVEEYSFTSITGGNYCAPQYSKSLLTSLGLTGTGMCAKGIIYNLGKWQAIDCGYVSCLKEQALLGANINVCKQARDFKECTAVFDEVFELPIVNVFSRTSSLVAARIENIPMELLTTAVSSYCTPGTSVMQEVTNLIGKRLLSMATAGVYDMALEVQNLLKRFGLLKNVGKGLDFFGGSGQPMAGNPANKFCHLTNAIWRTSEAFQIVSGGSSLSFGFVDNNNICEAALCNGPDCDRGGVTRNWLGDLTTYGLLIHNQRVYEQSDTLWLAEDVLQMAAKGQSEGLDVALRGALGADSTDRQVRSVRSFLVDADEAVRAKEVGSLREYVQQKSVQNDLPEGITSDQLVSAANVVQSDLDIKFKATETGLEYSVNGVTVDSLDGVPQEALETANAYFGDQEASLEEYAVLAQAINDCGYKCTKGAPDEQKAAIDAHVAANPQSIVAIRNNELLRDQFDPSGKIEEGSFLDELEKYKKDIPDTIEERQERIDELTEKCRNDLGADACEFSPIDGGVKITKGGNEVTIAGNEDAKNDKWEPVYEIGAEFIARWLYDQGYLNNLKLSSFGDWGAEASARADKLWNPESWKTNLCSAEIDILVDNDPLTGLALSEGPVLTFAGERRAYDPGTGDTNVYTVSYFIRMDENVKDNRVWMYANPGRIDIPWVENPTEGVALAEGEELRGSFSWEEEEVYEEMCVVFERPFASYRFEEQYCLPFVEMAFDRGDPLEGEVDYFG